MKRLFIYLNYLRFLPHIITWKVLKDKKMIYRDLQRWVSILRHGSNKCGIFQFVDIMTFFPPFRNLFYARIRNRSKLLVYVLKLFASPQPLLDVSAVDLGGGCYIQHGFSTIIAAKSVGENLWINQCVTIGYTNANDCPTIGDNVTIGAGAKVIGNIRVGNNAVIGANAVVVKDVPDIAVVVGIPAKIIKFKSMQHE